MPKYDPKSIYISERSVRASPPAPRIWASMRINQIQHRMLIIANPTYLSMEQGRLFCFVCHALWSPKPCTSCRVVGIFVSYWLLNHSFDENYIKFKLKTVLEFGCVFGVVEKSWRLRFNKVYFTIFGAKVWKILISKLILLLKIQTNCNKWVWKEKSVEPSMCSHCRILFLNRFWKCEK